MPYKVIVVGDAGTGKTTLLNRYVYNRFDDHVSTTIGIEFMHKHVDGDIHITFWDTAGQERYQSMTSAVYKNSDAVMFVYDVSSPSSLQGLHRWWREYISYGNREASVAIVVGNKIDLERHVPKEEALSWAVQHNLLYDEVSAKTEHGGVDRAFETLVKKLRELPRVQRANLEEKMKPKKDQCCS